MNMNLVRVFYLVLIVSFIAASGSAPRLNAQTLDNQMVTYLGEALLNSDISWSVKPNNGKNYLEQIRFGLKETFLNDFLHRYPPQKDGDLTIKELFLDRMEARGNQLNMRIGGVMKYKPVQFFQASGNFIVPAHLAFDQSKKEITFTIESKFEKLTTKQFNIDVKKIGNRILKKLKANDQVKRIQVPQLMAKIEQFKPLFTGFSQENGYLYIAAVPEKPLWVSGEVIQALEAFKAARKK